MPNPITRHIEPLLPTGVAPSIDSATISVKITVATADIAQFADTATTPVGVSSSWAEVYAGATAYTDAATVSVKITPSGSDVYTPLAPTVDAATIAVVVTPSVSEFRVPGLIPVPTQIHFHGANSTLETNINASLGAAADGDLVTAIIASNTPVSSVSDDDGNTWTLDIIETTTRSICIASSKITSGGWSSGFNSITVNFATATKCVVDVWKWTGVNWLNVDATAVASGSSGSSGAMNGGTTSAILQPEELVLTAFASGGTISGGNGTLLDVGHSSGGTGPVFLGERYLLPGSGGSQSISGVTGDASDWVGATVTYVIDVPTVGVDYLVPIRVSFSGTEVKAKEYGDSGNFYVDVGFDLHDCFSHPEPNWVITDFKRWIVVESAQRWLVADEDKRWNAYEVVGAFDNTC